MAIDDPPILDLDPVDLPFSVYDRPTLMLSNLLLRGDVDAATRAIFAPNSLTPTETQTFKNKLLGPKPNKLMATLVDVATNPLVILGLVAGYLVWPIRGAAATKLAAGLTKAPPVGALSSWANSAFTNMRNLPGVYDKFVTVADDATSFITKYRDEFHAALKGTNIDETSAMAMAMRQQGWHKAGANIQGRWGLSKTRPIMTNYQGKATREMISAGDRIDNIFHKMRAEMKADPKKWDAFVANMKARGIDIGDDIDDYWPRHTVPNEVQQAFSADLKIPEHMYTSERISGNLFARTGEAIPDMAQLKRLEDAGWVYKGFTQELAGAVDKEVAQLGSKLRPVMEKARQTGNTKTLTAQIDKLMGNRGAKRINAKVADLVVNEPSRLSIDDAVEMLARPNQYSLDLEKGIERYLAGAGPTYSWHIKGTGNELMQLLKKHRKDGLLSTWQKAHIENELIPLVQGKKTWKQYNRNVAFGEWKSKKINWIRSHPVMQRVPAKSREFIIQQLDNFDDMSVESIANASNHYFYLSTLGGNLAPATRNLSQNILTVAPLVGTGNLMRGVNEVVKRAPAYLDDVIANKVPVREAFRKNFPEFVKATGDKPGIVEQMLGGDLIQTGTAASRLQRGALRKAQGALMAPFGTSETINRLVGFYAGRAQGLGLGMVDDLVNTAGQPGAWKVGRTVTDVAHFPGGALGMPRALMGIPAPLRQFMHFPLRYAGFLGSSVRWGANPNAMDFGTIGRTLAMSAGAYTAAKDLLGVDISQGLAAGALPIPQYTSAPFFPFPLVPPGVSAVGGIAKGVLTGDLKPVQETGWMLLPAGLAIKRLNRTVGPKYAGYSERTPDGRIPVFNKDKALIGSFTPFQLALRSIGITPMNGEQERAAAVWLASQRDKIRQYRRDWLNAMMANDNPKMEQIQSQFQKDYPELGPLKGKKSDITAIRNRREVSRLNRILKGFPRAYQPLFRNITAEAELASFSRNLDPINLPPALSVL